MLRALAARMSGRRIAGVAVAALLAGVLVPAPAYAAARVTVANASGDAKVDPTYATTLTVSGSGFQSVRGGHGGVYVFFGTVKPGWRPSEGGATGEDYLYVPDSEAKANQGHQRYVAFPGSDTAGSANGGTMSASGSWSTTLVVPGATFKTYDRAGKVRTVDCRKVTCGVITVGAHGVSNARNETFTPVRVGSLGTAAATTPSSPSSTPAAGVAPGSAPSADPSSAPSAAPSGGSAPAAATATLEVDRASAAAGNVLAFTAAGLPAGRQVSVVFDDGAAGAGPFAAGSDGRLAGVITLPPDVGSGTHELRLYGVDEPPSVRFAVQPGDSDVAAASQATDDDRRAAWLFAGGAGLVLVLALGRLLPLVRRWRRRAAA